MCANLYIFTIYHYSRDAYQYILLLSIFSKQFSGFYLILKNTNMQKKNAHLISWPSKAQNIQNLENIW